MAECSIVELRQYTLRPGQRDVLIELFEREFLEPQELAGMTLIGQFRVLGDADRFVWLRGFADMETRAAALGSFYGGPVWAAHRAAANATMIDSDNVLLLRPEHPGSGFAVARFEPFPTSAAVPAPSTYVARLRHLDEPADRDAITRVERTASAVAATNAGGTALAWFVSKRSPNNYPALPVREGADVFVSFASFPDAERADEYVDNLKPLDGSSEVIKLTPTPRSRLG
ncbi:MAG: NIPSNAP family protein [Candidatus Cybelea sp.]